MSSVQGLTEYRHLRKKSKRKIRIAWRDTLTGRFVAKPAKITRRYRKHRLPIKSKAPKKKGALKRAGTRRLFSRNIKFNTDSAIVKEVVYEIPFQLSTTIIDGKRKQYFEPSYAAIDAVFNHEKLEMKRLKKFLHTVACKVNVIFKDNNSPEDSDTWIQIPIGRRIIVDESDGPDEMYQELLKFLVGYDVWAINVIQLSVLRLPI